MLDRGVNGEAPLMHEFCAELERLGYKWAHRTVCGDVWDARRERAPWCARVGAAIRGIYY